MSITITEALAEIKTVGKRIEAKQSYVLQFIARQEGIKDPLEKDGGSYEVIKRERQAIADLQKRIVQLRAGISQANDKTSITIEDTTFCITDWLTWRREVAPIRKQFLNQLRQQVTNIRDQARKQGNNIITAGATPDKMTDVIININEAELAKEIEGIESVLGQLDGQLSLKNATVMIEG